VVTNHLKSSVLVAISGLAFLTKDALGTRFAMESVHRARSNGAKVSIIPGNDRMNEKRRMLRESLVQLGRVNNVALAESKTRLSTRAQCPIPSGGA
jgi:hypothetical protein